MLRHNKLVTIIAQHVSNLLEVPCKGIDINLVYWRSTPNWKYCLKDVDGDLINKLVGDHFSKSFLIFSFATILALNTKQEGIRDL